jgi:hypothetical protein
MAVYLPKVASSPSTRRRRRILIHVSCSIRSFESLFVASFTFIRRFTHLFIFSPLPLLIIITNDHFLSDLLHFHPLLVLQISVSFSLQFLAVRVDQIRFDRISIKADQQHVLNTSGSSTFTLSTKVIVKRLVECQIKFLIVRSSITKSITDFCYNCNRHKEPIDFQKIACERFNGPLSRLAHLPL